MPPSMKAEIFDRLWEDHIRPYLDSLGWIILSPESAAVLETITLIDGRIGVATMRRNMENEDIDRDRQDLINLRRISDEPPHIDDGELNDLRIAAREQEGKDYRETKDRLEELERRDEQWYFDEDESEKEQGVI